MLKFLNDTAELGTTGPLKRPRPKSNPTQTVTDMRRDLTLRATETIKALEAYQGGSLKAPMARTVRNGISIKFGYGKRNVGFFEGKGEQRRLAIPEKRFARDHLYEAIFYISKFIEAVNAGEFDEMLGNRLEEMLQRFSKAETKPSASKEVSLRAA